MKTVAAWMTRTLNSNALGVKFNITADVAEYKRLRKEFNDVFVIPGIVENINSIYEPIPDIVSYTAVWHVELFAYNDKTAKTVDVETVRAAIDSVLQPLIGEYKTISGGTVGGTPTILNFSTVSVGTSTNASGGGYARIPLYFDIYATIAEDVLLSNNIKLKIGTSTDESGNPNYKDVVPVSLSFGRVKVPETQTKMGKKSSQTLNTQQTLSIDLTTMYVDNDAVKEIVKDIMTENYLNKVYYLSYQDDVVFYSNSKATYKVVLSSGVVSLELGKLASVQASFLESWEVE
jgi:hypothetical protein